MSILSQIGPRLAPLVERRWCSILRTAGAAGVMLLGLAAGGGCLERPTDPDVSMPLLGSFGEPGTSPGQFAYPRVMEATTHHGTKHLFIIDKAARIQWFENDAEIPRALWRTPRFDRGKPTGIAVHFDPDDRDAGPVVYIADTHESRILVQRPPEAMGEEPMTLESHGTYGYEPGEFIYPCDIEILTDDAGHIERFYVSEYGGHDRVSVFDASWELLFTFGSHGNPWDSDDDSDVDGVVFNRPQSLAIDRKRRVLYVADAINHRVGRFTLDGELLGWLGEGDGIGGGGGEGGGPSDAPGRFKFPYSLVVLDDGGLLVAEFGNSRVQLIDPDSGDRLALFGKPGRGRGELLTPWEIAVDGDRLLVLDSGNARVSMFELPRGLMPARVAGSVAGSVARSVGRGAP